MHRMFSHRVLVTMIVAIFLAAFSYLAVIYWSQTLPGDFNFQVKEKDTIHTVAKNLMDQGVIKHRAFFYFSYYAFGRRTDIEPGGYKLSSTMKIKDIVYTLESKPSSKFVTVPAGASKEDIAKIMTDTLGWSALDLQFFSHTYAGMQWQFYQEHIQEFFKRQYSWNDKKTNTFLTLSALYYDRSYDFLKGMYMPGTYEIPLTASRAQVAGILIDTFAEHNPDPATALEKFIDLRSADSIAKLIDEHMVLMPDIVTIPPQDVTLKKIKDRTYLLFTTSYWNKGRGPLELLADPKTKGITGDLERDVLQRIYSLDGNYTERLSGKFLWHNPHLHYHFKDFAVYSLERTGSTNESVEVEEGHGDGDQGGEVGGTDSSALIPASDRQSQKSTFCIRDIEPIDLTHPGANKGASYAICGKERQGISPGWSDVYYYTYVDQRFDVTGLQAGEYTLKIVINPFDRFDEMTKDNNVGEVVLDLDPKNNKVKVLSEKNYGI